MKKNYDHLYAFLCACVMSAVCINFSKMDIIIILLAAAALIFLGVFLVTTKYHIQNFKPSEEVWISKETMSSVLERLSDEDNIYLSTFKASWVSSLCMFFGTIYLLYIDKEFYRHTEILFAIVVLLYVIVAFLIRVIFLLDDTKFYRKEFFRGLYYSCVYTLKQEVIFSEEELTKYKDLKSLKDKPFQVYMLKTHHCQVLVDKTNVINLEKLVNFIGKDVWNNEVESFKKPLKDLYLKKMIKEQEDKVEREIAQRCYSE